MAFCIRVSVLSAIFNGGSTVKLKFDFAVFCQLQFCSVADSCSKGAGTGVIHGVLSVFGIS